MTERTKALRKHTLNRRGGAYVCYLWPLAAGALAKSEGEPIEIRRAKAQAYVLDNAPLAMSPGDLIIGSLMAFCPPDPSALDPAQIKRTGAQVAMALAPAGRAYGVREPGLTRRAHGDSRIPFAALRKLLRELPIEQGLRLRPGQLRRALTSAFSPEYADAKRKVLDLPWHAASSFAPDFEALLDQGFRGLDAKIRRGLKLASTPEKRQFYAAQQIVLGACQRFILRYANAVSGSAQRTTGPRSQELSGMAQTLRFLAIERPDSFYEGLQLIMIVLVMLRMLGSESVALGRLDQLLITRYERDLERGVITADEALELLECAFIKLNEPGFSGTCAITLGGATELGPDRANALTGICLRAAAEVALPHPTIALRLQPGSPRSLIDAAAVCAASGCGQPIVLNDDIWPERLGARGYNFTDAQDYALIGEGLIGAPGKSPSLMTALPLDLPRVLGDVLQSCAADELPAKDFDQFMDAYCHRIAQEGTNIWLAAHEATIDMALRARDPMASMLLHGCTKAGRDAFAGGSELGPAWHVPIVGLATATDALAAIRKWVYDKPTVPLAAIADGAGDGREQLIRLMSMSPRYGNDIPIVDRIAARIVRAASESICALSVGDRTSRLAPMLSDGTLHATLGEGALFSPGSHRQTPHSTGAEPHPSRDAGNLWALLNSAAALETVQLSGGFALTIPIEPHSLLPDKLSALIARALELGIPAVRLYLHDGESMREARETAGCGEFVCCTGSVCDWFDDLDVILQDAIIKRTVYRL